METHNSITNLRQNICAGSLKVKYLIVKGVVVRITRDGACLSLNVLTRVLESSWTTSLGISTGLKAALDATSGAGAFLLTGGITPEGVSQLHWKTYNKEFMDINTKSA